MIAPQAPKFQWGQRVRATLDLYNDGSYPERAADTLLVRNGDAGEIVQIGTHVASNLPIYLVEFGANHVVGCFEEEIAPLERRVEQSVERKEYLASMRVESKP